MTSFHYGNTEMNTGMNDLSIMVKQGKITPVHYKNTRMNDLSPLW